MRGLATTALLILLTALPARAQEPAPKTITLEAQTRLFERPDSTSDVRSTLPAGLALTVLTEQDGWFAVSISDDLSGWVRVSPERPRSLPRSPSPSERPVPTGSGPPPPPPTTTAGPPPPPARTGPPPPPTAARDAEARDREEERSRGGLYDAHSWTRFHYDVQEDVQGVGFQFGIMLSNLGELEANLVGSRTSLSSDDIWSVDLILRYALYFLQPTDELPVGAYGAALGAFQRFFPPEGETQIDVFSPELRGPIDAAGLASSRIETVLAASTSGCCGIHENVARVGGEGGGFARLATGSVTVIPRLAYRWTKRFVIGEEEAENFSYSTLVAGAEVLFGRIAPSVYVSRTEEVNLISIGLALPSF